MNGNFHKVADVTLLEALQQGDEQAFSAIYERYWYKVFLIAYRRLKDKELAKELVQEIFLKLWKNRLTLRITQLENYLVFAVKYAVIDHIRSNMVQDKYQAYYQLFMSTADSNTEDTLAYNDLLNTVNSGLETLPQKSREVFRLNRLENWPVPKIALHLKLSEKAVEYHLTKSLKILRAYLREYMLILLLLLHS
jgi:RNA polymerase sigma-70 factor (ECF subfamily)